MTGSPETDVNTRLKRGQLFSLSSLSPQRRAVSSRPVRLHFFTSRLRESTEHRMKPVSIPMQPLQNTFCDLLQWQLCFYILHPDWLEKSINLHQHCTLWVIDHHAQHGEDKSRPHRRIHVSLNILVMADGEKINISALRSKTPFRCTFALRKQSTIPHHVPVNGIFYISFTVFKWSLETHSH